MARIALIEGSTGKYLVNAGRDYITQALFSDGSFEPATVAIANAILLTAGPTAKVIDVGANLGSFTVPVALKLGERGSVVAFEPQRSVFYQLCGNLFINDLGNVIAHHLAVGGAAAHGKYIQVPVVDRSTEENIGAISLIPNLMRRRERQVDRFEYVNTVSLDSFFTSLDRLDLIKIDVEGMEIDVLNGAERLIKTLSPTIICEAFDDNTCAKLGIAPVRPAIINFFDELGYEFFDLGGDLVAQSRSADRRISLDRTPGGMQLTIVSRGARPNEGDSRQ